MQIDMLSRQWQAMFIRARKTLYRLGVSTNEDIANLTKEDILKIKGCGQTGLMSIRQYLKKFKLKLRRS